MILAKAELLLTQCEFSECLVLFTRINCGDNYNFSIYSLFRAFQHELSGKNTLFLISHDVEEHYQEEPVM